MVVRVGVTLLSRCFRGGETSKGPNDGDSVAPKEVSVSHSDGIRQILLQPLWKSEPAGKWYELLQLPDWRFNGPMSTLDPKKKVERSKNLASGYSLSNVVQNEDAVSHIIEMLLDWMNKYAETQKPTDLDKFFTFTAFDIVGEVPFSKQFGFLQQGLDGNQEWKYKAYFTVVPHSCPCLVQKRRA